MSISKLLLSFVSLVSYKFREIDTLHDWNIARKSDFLHNPLNIQDLVITLYY